MSMGGFNVLLVEPNAEDARLLGVTLKEINLPRFHLNWSDTFSSAVALLEQGPQDLILLGLASGDEEGYDQVEKIRALAPDTPVVVLTPRNDSRSAVECLKRGAHDYLVKGQNQNNALILRSLLYAVERSKLLNAVKDLTLTDALTGLHNLKGFEAFAGEHVKLASRKEFDFTIVYVRVSNLESINTEHGREAGDKALVEVADLLNASVRESDLVARFSGSEFVVLALDCSEAHMDVLESRLQRLVGERNAGRRHPFKIAVTFEVTYFNNEDFRAWYGKAEYKRQPDFDMAHVE